MQLLITAEAIDLIGDPIREVRYVAFVAADVQQVNGNLVTRLHHHLARLRAGRHHPHLDFLTQRQQRHAVTCGDDKSTIVAFHTVKRRASLKGMLHRRISPPRILWEFQIFMFHSKIIDSQYCRHRNWHIMDMPLLVRLSFNITYKVSYSFYYFSVCFKNRNSKFFFTSMTVSMGHHVSPIRGR